ncbi:DUF6119 family protein [Streptomyces monticola]|uniref:DUF6119 family protein n=1 Tax=Streptomyces monticola TaxID=2666263 RepID=A0ABW2JMK7_9ACTN
MASNTAKRTLYRLCGVVPTREGMFDALDHEQLDALGADIRPCPDQPLDAPALLVTAGLEKEEASWCRDVARTTGCEVSESVRRTAALLMLAVDGQVYAIGYDQGYRLVPDHLKDKRFGLAFAIRRVDPQRIRDLVANTMGQARTDITIVPGGTPMFSLGVREHAQFVRRLGGYLDDVRLTRTQKDSGNRAVASAEGGVGLKLALGIAAQDLVADIREIERVCQEELPHAELEFVDHIVPVKDASTLTALEQELDDILGQPADGRVAAALPVDIWQDVDAARAYSIKINSPEPRMTADGFDLDYVLARARIQRPGRRVEALKQGTVTLYRHPRATATDALATTSTLRWLEAAVSLDARRYCLMDGEWYELGAAYLEVIRVTVARLIVDQPSVDLPAWYLGHREGYYNEKVVPSLRAGYVSLDRKNVRNPLNRTNGVEICDLLTPDNTLVMVKRAYGSDLLSHLFNQGVVAVQLLQQSAQMRAEFAERVLKQSNGERVLPKDYQPEGVVFAILLKNGTPLTPDTLFPFAQIALVQAAKTLEASGVAVEVVGIEADSHPATALPGFREAA